MILASDIDKTLTDPRGLIPDEVANYLGELHKQGCTIVLVTGRNFTYAMQSLEKFEFPYYLAVQNGAEILSMPEKEILYQTFLPKSIAYAIDKVYKREDFLLYSGLELGDFCYYRTSKFTPSYLSYIERLKRLVPTEWQEVSGFDEIQQAAFPLIKGLGYPEDLFYVQDALGDLVNTSVILDSVAPDLSLLLITHAEVNKGLAIKKLRNRFQWKGPIIAAGDDRNDIPLFQMADVNVVMPIAPKEVMTFAHIRADRGIIDGIAQAIKLVS